jgi:putative tryptophan/tyrosine transport system substrate-binding protein
MRRRDFIKVIASSAAAWPLAARAQQPERVRRIGVLMNLAENQQAQARITAFRQALAQFGWTDRRNVQIEIRWTAGDADHYRNFAAELTALVPDVILATGTPAVEALQRATRTTPIVFVAVVDPVGAGLVANLARPGGNTTGFSLYEYGLVGKSLELLKQISPPVTRVGVLRDSANPAEIGQLAAIQTAAPSLGVEVSPIGLRDAGEIERAITEFARVPNGALIVPGSSLANNHRELIIGLAARHQLPAIYSDRIFITDGGLVSYGPDRVDQYRRAAEYIDRILKGEKPADLPVQAPTKYELVINLKTAKALGLTIPPSVLARADEVIE